jgi:predicted nucleic acid-binding protein
MGPANPLLLDCSVTVKWKITSEPHAAQARELLLDWQQDAVQICVPDQLLAETVSAFLGACRKHPPRLTVDEARSSIREILALPFTILKTTAKGIALRAFEIAHQYGQRAYDSMYVALAERKRITFWTGDERLYNAFHRDFPFVSWIANYTPQRPTP